MTERPYHQHTVPCIGTGVKTVWDSASAQKTLRLFLPHNGHTPPRAERARSHFEGRGGLLPLKLRGADQLKNPAYGGFVEALGYDVFGRLAPLDMQLVQWRHRPWQMA